MADEDEIEVEGGSGGKLKLIIMIVVGVLLVAGLSVGATWFLLKDRLADPNAEGMSDGGSEPSMALSETQGPALYHALQPAFVINYNSGGRSRFVQTELTVLTRDPASIEALITHNPLIRNNLLDVFSRQDVSTLLSEEGKQKLADELTTAIQDILVVEIGRPGIEAVLFRSFIMQ